MPYPNDIIKTLTDKYQLSPVEQKQLEETLAVEGMQSIIETTGLNPDGILNQSSSGISMLLPVKANALVESYREIQKLSEISITQLSDLILWCEYNQQAYPYVLSPCLIKQSYKIKELKEQLAKIATTQPNEMKQWDDIRSDIKKLANIPRSKFRERKLLANQIIGPVLSLSKFIRNNPILGDEYDSISAILPQHMNAAIEPIENASREYFINLFKKENKIIGNPEKDISFFAKPTGDQMGRKINIKYKYQADSKEHEINYYIKTHQHGSTHSASSAKPVDPKELFVYKVLELTGFGPKVHFFLNPLSSGGFFIATQDIAFTKDLGKNKIFERFDLLRPRFEKLFEEKRDIENEAKTGITCTDILSRIFRLHDVTTNPTNFGRVTVDNSRHKWKILDFRVDSTDSYAYVDIFGGFKAGNGMYNYVGIQGEIIRDRPENERIQTAREVIAELEAGKSRQSRDGNKMPLLTAINQAYAEITKYIQANAAALGINFDKASVDLNNYVSAAKENFSELSSKVKESQANFAQQHTSITLSTKIK